MRGSKLQFTLQRYLSCAGAAIVCKVEMTGTIAITGFMGAGKTTVAAALAARLGRDVIDLDDALTHVHDRTPQEIIDIDGEEHFRELETKILATILTQNSNSVIALGGGTGTLARNRELLASSGAVTIWLDAPFELCWQRIKTGGESRPLARTREAAKSRFEERLQDYQTADMRIEVTANEGPDEIAERIAVLLKERGTY